MKRTVNKTALIKIISRYTDMYSKEQIAEIIENEGAAYFNFTGLKITYLNFGKWLVEAEKE